jgi:hypothetical protein
MDTQVVEMANVPEIKLLKVGKERERKRAGGAWFGLRGAGSGFSGAIGGAGAGGLGGVLGTGMSMAKLLTMLFLAAVASGSAWRVGSMLSADSANSKAGPKVIFSPREEGTYADLSGVIKADKNIPNSLGYINNDGLTDEQRAKKLADEEAARKAAEEAKKKAEADAQAKADQEAANKAGQAPEAAPPLPGVGPDGKKDLVAGRFGRLSSGTGGGGALAGGAGLSGGITRNFSALTGAKPQGGALGAFRTPTKPSASAVSHRAAGKSNSKGFAKRQLDNAFSASRVAVGASKSESASAGAAAPFDNNAGIGSVISGPGVGNTTGGVDTAGSPAGGPVDAPACGANSAPDASGTCQPVSTPGAKNAAPYQSLIMMAQILLGIIALLAMVELAYPPAVPIVGMIIGVLGGVLTALGAAIFKMSGDKMMGGIMMGTGAFVAAMGFAPSVLSVGATMIPFLAAGEMIAAVAAEFAAIKVKSASLQ